MTVAMQRGCMGEVEWYVRWGCGCCRNQLGCTVLVEEVLALVVMLVRVLLVLVQGGGGGADAGAGGVGAAGAGAGGLSAFLLGWLSCQGSGRVCKTPGKGDTQPKNSIGPELACQLPYISALPVHC